MSLKKMTLSHRRVQQFRPLSSSDLSPSQTKALMVLIWLTPLE